MSWTRLGSVVGGRDRARFRRTKQERADSEASLLRIVQCGRLATQAETLASYGMPNSAGSRDTGPAMPRDNVERVRQIYAEWERGNMRAGVELFHPELVFESFMPDANDRIVANGLAEVEEFMREFLGQWRDYRLVGDEFRAIGDEKVLVIGHQTAMGRQSRVTVEYPMSSVWTFRDGKVVHLLFEPDRQSVLEAAGLSE